MSREHRRRSRGRPPRRPPGRASPTRSPPSRRRSRPSPGAENISNPGAQPVVDPDRAVGARDLVAQVHAAAEGPGHLELRDGAARVAHDARSRESSASIGWTWVAPQHTTSSGRTSLPTKLRPISMQWQPMSTMRAAARELLRPEPVAVRAGVRLARARPQHAADGAPRARTASGLQRLRRVDEVLEVAVEDAGLLDDRPASRCASAAVRASGFVQRMALPAAAAASTASRWR